MLSRSVRNASNDSQLDYVAGPAHNTSLNVLFVYFANLGVNIIKKSANCKGSIIESR